MAEAIISTRLKTPVHVKKVPQEPSQMATGKGTKYTILTENFPPFNYVKNGKLTGISTEIVQKILDLLDIKSTRTRVMDWKRSV